MRWHTIAVWLWDNTAGNVLASAVTTGTALAWHHRRIKQHITAEIHRARLHAAHDTESGGTP